jgi:glyoxylase-like metal-dependent hydrolase (beta-lactamase superfamily II)
MLRVEMLPAANGDALWIEYGDEKQPRRILVDGGTEGSWPEGLRARVASLPPGDRRFELLVVTHIDNDHIDGALELLGDQALGAKFGDVWFNGWRHLPDTPLESLGPVEGERLTEMLSGDIPWNEAFDGRAVGVPNEGKLRRRELAGGLHVTVLAPTAAELAALKPVWRKVVEDAGLVPGQPAQPEPEPLPEGLETLGPGDLPDVAELAALPFKADRAEANGSSIVVLLEHEGASVLLCGDAFPAVVSASLERLRAERGGDRIAVGAFKLPHHGSHANISKDLVAKLDCPRYLFSSNGAHTRHPHPQAVARVLVADEGERTLFFNYRTGFNEVWANEQLRTRHQYSAAFPPEGGLGITVDV